MTSGGTGSQAFETYSNSAYGGNFETLSARNQVQVLTDLSNNKPTTFNRIVPADFFIRGLLHDVVRLPDGPAVRRQPGTWSGGILTAFNGTNQGNFYGEGLTTKQLMVATTPDQAATGEPGAIPAGAAGIGADRDVNRNSTNSLWTSCVLGLGVTGGIVATELATNGYKVVGIEKGPYWDYATDFALNKYDEWGVGMMHKWDHPLSLSSYTWRNNSTQFAIPFRRYTYPAGVHGARPRCRRRGPALRGRLRAICPVDLPDVLLDREQVRRLVPREHRAQPRPRGLAHDLRPVRPIL